MKEAKFSGNQEEPKPEVEEKKLIEMVEVPSQYSLAFKTPEGLKDANEYLVWLGNILLDLKLKLVGN